MRRITDKCENAREYLQTVAEWGAWQFESFWDDLSPADMIQAYEITMRDGVEAVEDSRRASRLIGIEPSDEAV